MTDQPKTYPPRTQPVRPASDFSLPYSEEAEQAVLGAILVNPEAFLTVASFLKADDFFLQRHGYIWQALERLNNRSVPVDYLTLAQELHDMGMLDTIGGMAYITQLVNSTPTSMHAEFYGRIVERVAVRRRLMATADEIKALALDESLDIDAVVGGAETRLFSVTERQLKREFVTMHDAVNDYWDRIEYLSQNQDKSFGVPSGFRKLDELLGGFQRSDLLIFAGRPGMGKTSFLLSAAVNAARLGQRIAIFTMEMGADQIVQRIFAMETGINTQKLRLGQLTPAEQARFAEAAGRIARLPIFVDDTPALNPIQMRTKCRRLQHEHGIDMVIVDYMQLMNAGGAFQNNRVQEVSMISRNLKELARELNVPIFSAAQLSRAVEQRQDKRPVLSDLRESGCLAGESMVYLPDEGRYLPIRDIVNGKMTGVRVLSLNTETWKMEPAVVSNAFCTGVKPVYRLTTRLGRSIQATANHKFLTIHGWKRLDELTPDEHIALPRYMPTLTEQTMSDAELALLGHLIGDGCTLPSHAIQYTTREADLAEIVAQLAKDVFGDAVRPRVHPEPGRNWYQVFIPPTQQLTHGVHNPVRLWLEKLGVWGLRSYEKFVPEKVFQQPKEAVARFLRHLWATDGCIAMKKTSKSIYPQIYYATSSPQLANDVQTLLLQVGINARVKCVPQVNKGRDQYHVILGGGPDFSLFAEMIGAVSELKSARLGAVKEYLATHEANTNRDVIPHYTWRMYAVPSMQQNGITSRKLHEGMEMAYAGTAIYKQNVSRDRAQRVANVVGSEEIAKLAQSDVYWDQIDSITPDGETEVYDLTVPGNNNFVAQNLFAHNSIEQDSDIVIFLYRDVVYNEATEFPNQADLIVAKHRNGPTGTVSLYFDNALTKFMDGAVRRVDLGEY